MVADQDLNAGGAEVAEFREVQADVLVALLDGAIELLGDLLGAKSRRAGPQGASSGFRPTT